MNGATLERELAQLWADALRLKRINVDHDFFDLGGQSVIAMQLLARLRERHGIELPLTTFLVAPTVATFAALVAEKLRVGPEPFRTLVPLQHGTAPGLPPFFCVHGVGGNVMAFRPIARALPRARSFYGVQAYGVDGMASPLATIEEMASTYLSDIREIQPRGPYVLGGYSAGGVVALEMAQQLGRAGESVSFLALIDSYHPHAAHPATRQSRLATLRAERLDYFRSAADRYLLGPWRARRDDARIAYHIRRGEAVPAALRERYVRTPFLRACAQYQPVPWNGVATLLRAQQKVPRYPDPSRTYGWDAIMRIEVIDVPGDHTTIVTGTNARLLGRALGIAIEAAHGASANGQRQGIEYPNRSSS